MKVMCRTAGDATKEDLVINATGLDFAQRAA